MASSPHRPPPGVIAGLVLAIVLDTVTQVSWKMSANGPGLLQTLTNPWFAVAMAALCLQFWNWMRVLGSADLSFAQPITALSYVTVLSLSAWCFHDRLTIRQALGIASILVGVWFISRTPHVTTVSPAGSRKP